MLSPNRSSAGALGRPDRRALTTASPQALPDTAPEALPDTARRALPGSMPQILPGTLPRTLSDATAFIEARAGLNVTLGELARAVGVSPRALQLTFRRHLHLTPMGYARRVRIAHAHRGLVAAASDGNASVTRIALDWGFANPSRFAAYYRAAYGRPPHATLRG